MIVPQSNAAGCVNIAKALAQLGKSSTPVVSNPLCLDPDVAAGLGGDLPKWIYGIASSLGFDMTDPAVPPFVKGLTLVGQPKLAADAWVIVAWGQILTTVKLMNQIGVNKRHLGELHDDDPGVQGPAGPRRAEPPVREVPGRAGRLQRPDAVLPVPGSRQVQAHHRLPQAAEHLQARGLSQTSPRKAGPRPAAPPPPGLRLTGMDWQQIVLFAILGLGAGSLIAGHRDRHRPHVPRLGDHQPRDRARSRCSPATRTGR